MVLLLSPPTLSLLGLLSQPLAVLAGNTCGEITWASHEAERDGAAAAGSVPVVPHNPYVVRNATVPQPGDLVCRFWVPTYSDVNCYTCTELSKKFRIDLDFFFTLNPTVLRDCSNIQPLTEYCVAGFFEPLRATDGFCGPQHNNATCFGTAKPCCNAVTFTCGDSDEDCAPGTCYEGKCPGDKYYSTDGTCGFQHGGRQCAGKWGECCNMSGVCGNGTAFCGGDACHSGNCDWKNPGTHSPSTTSRSSSTSTTTTSSSSAPTVTNCNAGTGPGGYLGLCSYSCSFGFCPPPCTCTSPGTPNPAPPLTGDHGYALIDVAADFGPLCEFACSHGYVADGVCTTVPYTTTPGGSGTACVHGVGSGALKEQGFQDWRMG